MAITGRGRPTHFVSQNKRIHLWHRRLAHISNAHIVRASKLVDGVSLDPHNKEYDSTEVLVDSDNSDMSDLSGSDDPSTKPERSYQSEQPASTEAIVATAARLTKATQSFSCVNTLERPGISTYKEKTTLLMIPEES